MWKSFLRGLNPIFMDTYDCMILTGSFDSTWAEPLRISMGYSLILADRMDLISMTPEPDLASSNYCLANPGVEYLVYLPDNTEVSLNLEETSGAFSSEWFNPATGKFRETENITGGQNVSMDSPFETSNVLVHLKKMND